MGVKGGGTSAVPRANVALTPEGVEALRKLQRRKGLSTTDIVNRALQLYAEFAPYVEAEDGRAAFIQDPDGELVRFRVF